MLLLLTAVVRQRKRKEFEDGIRRNRNAIPLWVKYAMWEETQLEFDRARSVWERALEIGETGALPSCCLMLVHRLTECHDLVEICGDGDETSKHQQSSQHLGPSCGYPVILGLLRCLF